MPREVVISSRAGEKEKTTFSDDSPPPKPVFGKHRQAQVLVISDSDSDSDSLPSPSRLRLRAKPVASGSNRKAVVREEEIINISSDSEVELLTPTKPRVGARLPLIGKANSAPRPAAPPARALSASPSSLTEALKRTTLRDDTTRDEEPPIELDYSEEDAVVASPAEELYSSTPNESNDDDIFDGGLAHPGLITFDPGPRRPRLLPLDSGGSVSTPPTSQSSQSSIWDNDTPSADLVSSPSASPVQSRANSQHDDEESYPRTPGPSHLAHKTGNAKAGSSGSGYRSRVKGSQDVDSAAPETPKARPRPKPKAQVAIATSSSTPLSLSPKPTPRNRAKVLEAAAIALFLELNESVFDGLIPKDCPIVWSKKLNTTAGRAHWKRIRGANGEVLRHDTSIELSTKVVDCEERIRNTLSHEMCHLAAWIFDSETNKPHGPAFKRWGNRVMEIRSDIVISTCHSYEISYKYEWKCSSEECGRTYGRHSKSIDPAKQVCGACRGQLVPLFATTLRQYLKIHMKDFKAANPGMQHGEAMKRLGEMFRAEKEATVDAELDQVMAGMTRLALDTPVG